MASDFKLNIDADVEINRLTDSQILIPGLIDAHVHAPQYPNAGLGYDKALLEWLDCYTYKLESQYKDLDFARAVFDRIVRKTLDCGTTTACYFASLFSDASLILADSCINHGQRAFVGKVSMTKSPLADYVETEEECVANVIKFVNDIISRNEDLVKPIITPRFALSLNMNEMAELGRIAANSDLHIQTHVSENREEVELVRDIFNLSYAEVYDETSLLTKKTILAHGIYLTDDELKLISNRGSSIAHCPESNTCLKSGLCDVKRLHSFGVNVALGSDVSGGPLPSIIRAMRSALDVSVHLSFQNENYEPLTYREAFYLGTLGGAKALGIDDRVGSFEVGKEFDALIVDMATGSSSCDYLVPCDPLELLQKFIYLGDDRNVLKVYVSGKCVK
ncbi:guanine deaminase isoform X2 [Cylas formicarius]|nr:guanine deaminase isoform X2 [Cylas formicarius]